MKIQPGVGYTFDSSSKGFTLDTSDPFPTRDGIASLHPLQIYGLRYDTATNTAFYKVYPGTINNLVPQIEEDPSLWVKLDRLTAGIPDPPEGVITTAAGIYYIYLRTGPDATTSAYPSSDDTSARYPRIISVGTVQSDTDTEGYILLAHGSISGSNVITNYQDVSSSLWADRIKVNGSTARYYYARI
ncbi:hypothetical protein K0U83_00195 [bacterium]|nr:hypothetical protein [bacterium]